jgi:uncharacterized membrane protein
MGPGSPTQILQGLRIARRMGCNVLTYLHLRKPQMNGSVARQILMTTLPLIPEWQQIHPLIVHFPIAILLVAPFFVLIGILRPPESSAPFQFSALSLMVIGTIASIVAVRTGLAARSQMQQTPDFSEILEQHQNLAETSCLTFCVLTVVFAAIVVVPRQFSRQLPRVITTTLPAVFLLLYAAGAVLLANTAHTGGCLVHEFGITAAPAVAHRPVMPRVRKPSQDYDTPRRAVQTFGQRLK